MKLKITSKREREIEYWAKAAKFMLEIILGAVAIWGIWQILGLPKGIALSTALFIFLIAEFIPLYFDSMHLLGKKRNS